MCANWSRRSEALQSLAIARIFGGIPSTFFSSYHRNMPKSEPVEQYDLRSDLYELYHYLNHTVLFGVSKHGSGANVLMMVDTGWICQ